MSVCVSVDRRPDSAPPELLGGAAVSVHELALGAGPGRAATVT